MKLKKGHTANTKIAISIAKKGKPNLKLRGNKHYNWKGENISYNSLHHWITRKKGKSKKCEHCGKSGLIGRQIQWANIDHKYRRDLDDYISLCIPCHNKYDKKFLMERICIKCGKEYKPTINNQKYCGSEIKKTGCSFLMKAERRKEWYKKNKKK